MSVSTYINDISRITKEISDFDKDTAKEEEKISRLMNDVSSLQRSITSSTSISIQMGKNTQIASKYKDIATARKKVSDINAKKSQKQSELSRKEQSLRNAQDQEKRTREQEFRTMEQQDNRRRDTELRHSREVTKQMERQRQLQYEVSMAPQFIDLTRLPEKIKVLFLAANPNDQGQLRLDVEVRGIQEKIRSSEHRDSVSLISRWAVRTSDLLQHLNENSPNIVHFSGHGSEDGDLIFEGPDGRSKFVNKAAMVQVMNTMADNIRLVIFNSCFSADQAEAVTESVDAAIGMNTAIGDEAAQVFAAQFYSAIGFGKSIRNAFDQAISALMLEGIEEENTPELFVRAGTDAANMYLVRPDKETSVAFVRSPTAILPELKPEDVLVLKAACESDAKRPNLFVSVTQLLESLIGEGLVEGQIEESISILDDRGYIEEKGGMRSYIFVTNLGFDKYATAYLPGYKDMNRQIAEAIVNHGATSVEALQNFVTNTSDDVVERVLCIFEDRDFVKLAKYMGSYAQVLRWNASLKRWLETQA